MILTLQQTHQNRQLALILKAGYDPNLMINSRGQNGLQFMINYFGATDAHFRLQAPINKSAYLSMAKLLLDSGLDPNATDLLGDETVLFDAIRFNDREMVSLLLSYVDLSLRNKNGETALMCAARFGSKQVTRLMLDHLRHLDMDGYFLRQRNRFGLTPLELARAENLEAAKVLTKHLIAYGLNTGAVLARSSSHHQLVGRPIGAAGYPVGARRGLPAAAAAAAVADDFSASDFSDSEMLLAGPGPSTVMAATSRGPRGAYARQLAAAPYYDPKAAEFNQYLLEQQDSLRATAGDLSGRRQSDEDDADFGGGVAGGPLIRSRSCMLGPSTSGNAGASAGQSKYGQSKKSGGGGGGGATSDQASKMTNSWQDGQ